VPEQTNVFVMQFLMSTNHVVVFFCENQMVKSMTLQPFSCVLCVVSGAQVIVSKPTRLQKLL
jgi:hypothetical protein